MHPSPPLQGANSPLLLLSRQAGVHNRQHASKHAATLGNLHRQTHKRQKLLDTTTTAHSSLPAKPRH